jgi:hypothetical protein
MGDERQPTASDDAEVDPKAFLAALLRLSPEDAEQARQASPATRKRKPPEGPRHDYGEQ